MSKMSKIILIVLVIGLLFSLPIVPVNVVPEVTLRVVNTDHQPVANVTVSQDWRHWTFESQDHRDETVSDENGFATFSAKRIWISAFNFLFNTIGENTIGLIAIHASFGSYSHFIAKKDFEDKSYWGDNYFCYGSCKEGKSKEIVVKENLK